jgi:acetyl-CoA synthetase
MREIYGQTELVRSGGQPSVDEGLPRSMGKPSPQFDVDLVDEEGKLLPTGHRGRNRRAHPQGRPVGMFQGYHRDPERTQVRLA